ncbi:MAG: radical SAM/SPASM domain-containing protein, partial [Deltaproteobacteria bacterium]|nr:radical SAM/SPASM domain-containing protein [Deltaproteobacteria bacterium]
NFLSKNANRTFDLERDLPLPMPLGLCIEPTNRCNMSCKFCPVHLDEFEGVVGGLRFMAFDLYEKIVRDVQEMCRATGRKLVNLNLYGDGEPLLHKQLLEMIRLAIDLQIAENIVVTTNASALTAYMAERLIVSGTTHLRVSIYGMESAFHKQLTGSNVTPQRIFDNVKYLRKLRDASGATYPWIYAKMIGASETRGQLELFKQKYTGVADEVNVENPINWSGYAGHDLIGALDPSHEFNQSSLQGWHRKARVNNAEKKICTTPFLSLNVKSDGKVVICIVDWSKGTIVGDIGEESLAAIWKGSRLRDFRRMHIEQRRYENSSCQNCNVFYNSPDNIDEIAEKDAARLLS